MENKSERYILVQTDKEEKKRSIYLDEWTGGIVVSESLLSAKGFFTCENAKEVANVLNQLYKLTEQDFKVEVVHEVISRESQS